MDGDQHDLAQVSIFLAKESMTFDTVLDPEAGLMSKIGLVTHDFEVDGAVCRLFYFVTTTKKINPPWLDFLNDQLAADARMSFEATSKGPNGILLISVDKRLFAATFGRSAVSYLDKRAFEPDFGIKTAMNLCGNEEIRQTKTQSTSTATTHIDRQVSKPSEAFVFGLSEAEDLKYISAHMKTDKNITLQGRDNLTLKVIGEAKLSWAKLIDQCRRFIKHYKKKDYIKLFPNYRNFRSATEEEIAKLDETLISTLKARDFTKLHLAIPQFLDDDRFSFTYSNYAKRENILYGHLEVTQLITHFELEQVTAKELRAKRIYAYSHEDDRILESLKWPVYTCINFEAKIGSKYFILTDGRWAEVEAEFYNSIIDFVNHKLREEPCETVYRDIDIGDDEAMENREEIFNAKVVELRPSAIKFDKAQLRIGSGRANKEFCDVMDLMDDGIIRIIHCKPSQKGSSLNYLFAQAKFYCEAFLQDETLLTGIRAYIEKSQCPNRDQYLNYINPEIEKINGADYRVCLWILYDRSVKAPTKKTLPLIAQYELKLMHDHLLRVCKFREIIIRFVPVKLRTYVRKKKQKKKD